MIRIIYISTSRTEILPKELEAILRISRRNNRFVGVTGLLIGGGQRWLGKSGQAAKWSFCLKAASMAAEPEMR